jgi:hypothetical protein
MKTIVPKDVDKRLLYILHVGLNEIRNMALGNGHGQIADLADALEILPRLVMECKDEDLELIRFVLANYQEKYHSSYDYPRRFEEYDPPERY